MKRVGIVVTGFGGSGSTTLCKKLATEAFGLPRHYYAGGIIRWLVGLIEKQGVETVRAMNNLELLEAFETGEISFQPNIAAAYRDFPPDLDQRVDQIQELLLEQKDFGVHEGRIAPHAAKKLQREGRAADKLFIKILCEVDPWIGAERQLERPENKGKSADQVFAETRERLRWERERYLALYGIENHLAREHFNIVINTTVFSPEKVFMESLRLMEDLYPGVLAPYFKEK